MYHGEPLSIYPIYVSILWLSAVSALADGRRRRRRPAATRGARTFPSTTYNMYMYLDAFEPAFGGVWFLKLRGATLVHHALNPVNQFIYMTCISKPKKEKKLAKRCGRRAHYQSNNENSATFIGFSQLRKN